MNIAAAHKEDDEIEKLQRQITNLKRSNTLLKKNADLEATVEKQMLTVDQFCVRNSLSRGMYYKLLREGLVPKPVALKDKNGNSVMRRQFIKVADEEAWLKNSKNFVVEDMDTNHLREEHTK